MSAEPRVFYEPKIPLHDPDLYAFERQDDGVPAAAAGLAASLERYRDDGFLMVRGLLPERDVLAARSELEAMARADAPGCAMIWYEGALRDHVALDPGRDREMAAKAGGGAGFVNGQEGKGLYVGYRHHDTFGVTPAWSSARQRSAASPASRA